MNVEYTGRQFEVTLAIRMQVEAGLQKIQKILGNHFDTHVILSAENTVMSRKSMSQYAIIRP